MTTVINSRRIDAVADPVEAVRAIRPVLIEHRAWGEEHARLAPATLEAAREAGVFTLFAPREVRGVEATLPQVTAVFEELGYSDPTVGWHAGNSAAICKASTRLAPEERDRIFAGPPGPFGLSVVATGGAATVTEGGFILNGRWPFVTGCLDAPWSLLAGVVHEDGAPRMVDGRPDARWFIVPGGSFEPELTWTVAAAMRGTGSHAATVSDVFVPRAMTVPMAPGELSDRPFFRLPQLVNGLWISAAIASGIARRVFDEAVGRAAAKVSRFDGKAYRDNPGMQRLLGEAEVVISGFSLILSTIAEEAWREAEAGEISAPARGRMWSAGMWVHDQARRTVSDLVTVSTSSVYGEPNPVETGLRDLHAISSAWEHLRDLQTAYGRVLMGMEADNPLY